MWQFHCGMQCVEGSSAVCSIQTPGSAGASGNLYRILCNPMPCSSLSVHEIRILWRV